MVELPPTLPRGLVLNLSLLPPPLVRRNYKVCTNTQMNLTDKIIAFHPSGSMKSMALSIVVR
jgi:hypothetical protein